MNAEQSKLGLKTD